jgi:hypothetical protein
MSTSPDIHMTTLLVVVCAALLAERLVVVYFTRKIAKRKRRMWVPYIPFGLLGLVVIAMRSPAYSNMGIYTRPSGGRTYTHTGFSAPLPADAELPAKRRRRTVPLAGYHLPATDRVR